MTLGIFVSSSSIGQRIKSVRLIIIISVDVSTVLKSSIRLCLQPTSELTQLLIYVNSLFAPLDGHEGFPEISIDVLIELLPSPIERKPAVLNLNVAIIDEIGFIFENGDIDSKLPLADMGEPTGFIVIVIFVVVSFLRVGVLQLPADILGDGVDLHIVETIVELPFPALIFFLLSFLLVLFPLLGLLHLAIEFFLIPGGLVLLLVVLVGQGGDPHDFGLAACEIAGRVGHIDILSNVANGHRFITFILS